jgi:hypothetical protein
LYGREHFKSRQKNPENVAITDVFERLVLTMPYWAEKIACKDVQTPPTILPCPLPLRIESHELETLAANAIERLVLIL